MHSRVNTSNNRSVNAFKGSAYNEAAVTKPAPGSCEFWTAEGKTIIIGSDQGTD